MERSLAWITHARRLVRDYERLPAHSEAMITIAAVTLMTRRLIRRPLHATATVIRPGDAAAAGASA